MKKSAKITRKVKWVGWYVNQTDRRDNEWRTVWAKTEEEARGLLDTKRQAGEWLDGVHRVQEFKRIYGNLPC